MRKIWVMLIVSNLFPIQPALAQRPTASKAEVSDEVRQMCRSAVFKICKPGLIPDRAAIGRCAEENKDKLPPQCSVLLAARKQS